MTHQIFVSKLGFNKKGYNLIEKSDAPSLVISGKSIDYSEKVNYLKKRCANIELISLGEERNSLNEIEKLISNLKKRSLQNLFVFGGGSIIDVAKIIYASLKKDISDINLYVIPTKIGSGAESSITSIVNTKNKKIIKTNEEFLPSTVIYDTDIIKNLPTEEIIFGSMDALVHSFESMTSFLTNPYLNFFSNQTINYFFNEFKQNDLIEKQKFSDDEIIKLCNISFNGGLAQSNAGAGLCHAYAHAAEEITSVPHSRCIAYFIKPVLEFIESTNSKFIQSNKISNISDFKFLSDNLRKKIPEIKLLKDLQFQDKDKIRLLDLAKKDPCWRLFNLKGKKENIL